MLVILEGADGSGKTTLANKIREQRIPVYDISRHSNLPFDALLVMAQSEQIYCFDRLLITPWVYRLLRHEKLDSDDLSFKQTLKLLAMSKVVYCRSYTSYEDSMSRGEDNIVSKEEADKLQNIYDFVFNTLILYGLTDIWNYDWRYNTIEGVMRFIRGYE